MARSKYPLTAGEKLILTSFDALADTGANEVLKKAAGAIVNAAITGGLTYGGAWNASTNTPTLSNGSGAAGLYYYVSVAGSTSLDGISSWAVGDMLISNGTAWQKIDNTDAVTSVAGKTGAVTLALDDLTDVVITTPASGNFIRHNGTNFVNTTIAAGDIPSAVDAAKIANGNVSNTEFQYLDGVTSALQGQIDAKQATGNYITSLTGEVTASGAGAAAATVTNSAVIGKVLTGYVSGAGTVAVTDTILQAIQKLNGNDATNANLTGPITSTGNATAVASQTGTGSKFVMDTSPTLVTPTIGNAQATSVDFGANPPVNDSNVWSSELGRQAFVNGNCEIWQEFGTSITNPGNTTYTMDGMKVGISNTGTLPTTIIHSRQLHTSGDVFGAKYFYRVAPNGAGSGFGTNDLYWHQFHAYQGTRNLCGASQKVTFSFWGRSSLASKKIGLFLRQDYGTGGSPSSADFISGTTVTLTSSWVKYSITFTTATLVGKTFGTAEDDFLAVYIAEMWGTTTGVTFLGSAPAEGFVGSGTIDFSQFQLNAGDQALPFKPKAFDEELMDCQFFYEKSYSLENIPTTSTNAAGMEIVPCSSIAANTSMNSCLRYKVPKRITPTMTFRSNITANDTGKVLCFDGSNRSISTNIDVSYSDRHGLGMRFTTPNNASAATTFAAYHWVADARL